MPFISTSQKHLHLLSLATSPDFPTKIYAGQTFRGQEIDFAIYQDLATERLVDAERLDDMFIHHRVTDKGYTTLEQHQAVSTTAGWWRANRTWVLQQAINALITIGVSIATTLIVLGLKGTDGR